MTPKELLYIEDALGHKQQMQSAFTDYSGRLQDPELQQFVKTLADRQCDGYQRFYNLLNG
ncbi:MAG: hypothetical protein MJ132_03065 [Clostridia bacterium]|nr:hypothetical protein [Clostridia bacterium]